MPDGSFNFTPGTGAAAAAFVNASSQYVQKVLDDPGTAAAAPSSWTASTTAGTAFASDVTRRGTMICNNATGRVFIAFGANNPTTTLHAWWLDAGERWVVPARWVRLECRMVTQAGTSGTVSFQHQTAA